MTSVLEPVVCPFCAADDGRPFFRGADFTYVRCRRCGLVYQNPRYTFRHLRSSVYGAKYFRYELRNEENFFRLMLLNLRDAAVRSRTEDWPPPRKRFLDVGCATGRLLAHMRDAGWEVTGVDLCAESCRYGRRTYGVRILNTTLEAARFATSSFGFVHMSHVIEHLPDPMGSLTEVFRILMPGGLFLCVTPDCSGFQARLLRSRWRSAHRDHLTLFTRKTLRRALERTGFEVLRSFSYGGLAQGLAPAWVKRPLDVLAKRLGFGDVVVFLGRKPPSAGRGTGDPPAG